MLPFNWMFGFGNQFPYTNFHELNQDWMIAICKDLSNKFPELVQEVLKKLNAPEQAGEAGQFLVNLGEGKTSWENLDVTLAPVIIEAVNQWLDEHPEATTTVQDNTVSLSKLTESVRNEIINLSTLPLINGVSAQNIITKADIMSAYSSGNYTMQGAEYNPNRDRYVFCFASTDGTGDPIIIETDSNFQYIRASTIQNGGHLNDITYVPSADKYYCVTMETSAQIIVIDATDLDVLDIIQPTIVGTLTMLSYDKDNNCFIGYSYISENSASLYKFNANFSSAERIYDDFYTDATKNNFTDTITYLYSQGSTIINGHFISLFWFGFEHDPAITRLVVMDSTNTKIQYISEFMNINRYDESEAIINTGDMVIIPSYYSTRVALSYMKIDGVASLNENPLFDRLPQYVNTSDTPNLLDNIGALSYVGDMFKAWITLTAKPVGILGDEGILTGEKVDGYGWQTLATRKEYAYRSLTNNVWTPWYDMLLHPKETTSNILTLAEESCVGGVQYFRYTGNDFSWLPLELASWKWMPFKVEYCFSQRIVTVYDYTNKLLARNVFINNAWTGWELEGITNHTGNILTTALTVKLGHYTLVYTGTDTSWLPNSDAGYKLGYFEITNFSDGNIMVKAVKENCSEVAYNHYTNGAWTGWKRYSALT